MFESKKVKYLKEELEQLKCRVGMLSILSTNLIHELEILKEALFSKATLSPKQW